MYIVYKDSNCGYKCQSCYSVSSDAYLGIKGTGVWKTLCKTCLAQVLTYHKDAVIADSYEKYKELVDGKTED